MSANKTLLRRAVRENVYRSESLSPALASLVISHEYFNAYDYFFTIYTPLVFLVSFVAQLIVNTSVYFL